ncbi:uncharacterized protein LOC124537332 [Vanessa cardui]|uniref:uncharacterized protein LOC124537332 n=1 Tax=Vanessa cardui TaxID=171605 RepID=UPI001F146745|nr:uncharacterized protein LOC124537332 [Vanessa cardui]
MNQTSDNVSKLLEALLPSSICNEVACFVFYDEHPKDNRSLDLTVCSKRGVVQEFYQRELIDSILIENVSKVTEIMILRNIKCDLFYLVAATNEIIIISKKENLQIHQRIKDVHTYKLDDFEGRGQASLQVIRNDDAFPLVFDDNFSNPRERSLTMDRVKSQGSLPIENQLLRKLNEANYTTKCNETILKDYLKLRQMATYSIFQRRQTNLEHSLFKIGLNEISHALQIKAKTPIVKLCNKKVIIITSIMNKNTVPITDISVLLHGTSKHSLDYTTKIFNQIPRPPYWKEIKSQIDSFNESTVVAVIDIKELKYNVMSRIDFDIVVSFTQEDKSFLLPLESVGISALDTMGPSFDVLSVGEEEHDILMLAIIATSVRVKLCLRHIRNPDNDDVVTPSEIFCTYLNMDSLGLDNVAIYKTSPHHILYGVMIIFQDNISEPDHIMNIQVYSRSYSQVLALIHYMYDTVPYTIIATTPDFKLTAITEDLSIYNEIDEKMESNLNTAECARSLLKQSDMLKDYFDNCMIKMSESKNSDIVNKVGIEVDIMANGFQNYLEFRNQLLEESVNGIESLNIEQTCEPIIIDSNSTD